MLYHLLFPLAEQFQVFNLFRYITFRAVYAAITALIICLVFGPKVIAYLRTKKARDPGREYVPRDKGKKGERPSMGGLLILAALLISTLLWMRWDTHFTWLILFTAIWFGGIGFLDDYLKVVKGYKHGLLASYKLSGQLMGTLILLWGYSHFAGATDEFILATNMPIVKDPQHFGVFYIFFVILVILGASNSVNLTDGMDGLAIGCVSFCAGAFGVLAYVVSHVEISSYLNIIHVPQAGEMAVFCAALLGASLGFLWFNCYPAQVIMGDTGSLALGGCLGAVAFLIKQEAMLVVLGGVFVVVAGSVIAQVLWYKLRRKRIFLMAPLHHHFTLKGLAEPKIIVRFWIVSFLLTLLTLSLLKIR